MILIVEDNTDDSLLLTRQLARAELGSQVRVIGDGQKALDFLLESGDTPQVVFLDLRLPRLSGLDLLQQIRQDERLKTLPVIVMTSSLNPHDVEACAALGVTAYLPKPVGITTFARLLRPLLTPEFQVH